MPAPSRRTGAAGAAAVAGTLFMIYSLGASRTIFVGDSGELVTAVSLLGVPHPSGYPLYVLLGKAWTLLAPFGSIAFRMSLFSAAWAAAACGVLYLVCRRMAQAPIASLLAAGLLAFSPSFWSEANIQRTYSLNAFTLALVALVFQRWLGSRSPGHLALAYFLCGLGASNHLFMAVCAACVGVVSCVAEPSLLRRPARAAACLAAFFAGLLPYLYLPLRSRFDPGIDWGDPERLRGFLRVVLRSDYWDRAWIESPADLVPIAADYLLGIGTELAWGGVGLAIAGGVTLWRRRSRGRCEKAPGDGRGAASAGDGDFVLLPLLVMIANLTVVSIHGSRTDLFVWHRYYIPSYIMAALLAGAGCHALFVNLPAAARVAPLILPGFLLVTGWRDHDRGRYRVADDFSRIVLGSLPPGAHLIAGDDNILFPLMYLHLVEKARPDVHLIPQGVGVEPPPLRFDPDTEPLFLSHHPNWSLPELEVSPVGLLFHARRPNAPAAGPALLRATLEGEDDPRVPKDYLTRNLIGHFHYMLGVTFENRDWLQAREQLRRAAEVAPDNDALFYNLGLIYSRNGLLEDALEALQRSQAINPRHLASPRRPRASDKVAEVAGEQDRLAKLEASLAGDSTLREAEPDSPAFHARMAQLLEARGEPIAARAHRIRAMERRAGGSTGAGAESGRGIATPSH